MPVSTETSRIPMGANFWGKYDQERGTWLPLVCHCLDVALVFRALCDVDAIRRVLNRASGQPLPDQQLDRLAVLAALHDAGKANLGFQRKVFAADAPRAGHIRELAPILDPEVYDEELRAAFLQALPPELPSWFPDDQVAYSYLLAVFSHHGQPLCFKGETAGTYWEARRKWWRPEGERDPMAAVADISRAARLAFPRAFEPGGEPLPAEPEFHHRFAGLLMLADWLGSHPRWFPIEPVSPTERLQRGQRVVPDLLRAVGLDVRPLRAYLTTVPSSFATRFGFSPRPLQAVVDALDPGDARTRLLIAESETGSGKTEAALNWFFKLFVAGKVDSLYFALPTRVAARELYGRVHRTISRWFPDEKNRPVTLLAVPGYAQVDGVLPERVLPEAGHLWHDEEARVRRERLWAAEHPKRFLAATVAVGTVDQALLSAVQTAHAHLRSVCLDRSLLVVDEVHASDAYMSRLLEFLLDHHLRVGGYAMLLSATLGARARQRYVAVAARTLSCNSGKEGEPSFAAAVEVPYPAVTLGDGTPLETGTADRQPKRVHFEVISLAFSLDQVVGVVVDALCQGARVLVVLNTVGRANALLRAVERHAEVRPEWLFRCRGVACPHHGRFAPADRLVLDQEVSLRLGPGSGPGPLLVIGTQTLEQSLDIDADLLITDLAPADVLLQRVGRLHRHARPRPPEFEQARCLVLVPPGSLEEALDERGEVLGAYRRVGYGSVYADLRTLELTRRVLNDSPVVHIPQDNRKLVESITHPERLASLSGERWQRHAQNIEGGDLARAIAAGHAAATFGEYFGTFAFNEFGGRVAVRLGADSLQLPLSGPLTSPFGQTVSELVIPGHMAPAEPAEVVVIEDVQNGTALLRCGDRRYQYSRFGLEVAP